jgi:(p)ppGpp synthase/HD superfamily hydrolase
MTVDYTEKLVNEARMAAIKIHSSQNYDSIFPYEKHLEDVVQILREAGFCNKLLVAGYLHDSIEDGAVSYSKIKDYFGEDVAEIVYAVTDELGRNRKERKKKTYPKIRDNDDAIAVKLADRIANVEHGGKIGMYRKEHDHFERQLKMFHNIDNEQHEHLWKRLEKALGLI